MAFLDKTGLARLWGKITTLANTKVDKVEGKDLSTNDFTNEYKEKLDNLDNGGGGVIEETDPTVPAWAKAATKPTYTATEVGAVSNQDVKVGNNNWEQGDNSQGPSGKFLQAGDLSLKSGVYDGSPYHSVQGTDFKAGIDFMYKDEMTYSAGGSFEGGQAQFKAGDLLNVAADYEDAFGLGEVTMTVGDESITESELGNLKGLAGKTIPTKTSQLTNDSGFITTAPDEIYVGDGEMPDDATIQIIMDGVDEEEVLKNDLKDYIDDEIATELAKRGQLAPEFANNIEECVDITKLYVLPDGYIYSYVTKEIESRGYTNQIDTSIDEHGNVVGLLKDSRYNSSDTLAAYTGANTAGFIPCKSGDIIRFKNIGFGSDNSGSIYIRFYNNQFTHITSVIASNGESYPISPYHMDLIGDDLIMSLFSSEYTIDEAGDISSFTLKDGYDFAYMRFSFFPKSEEAIVTINEEITNETTIVTKSFWENTGHAFVTSEKVDGIITVDSNVKFVDSIEECTDENNLYVIDGFVYRFKKTIIETEPENKLVPSTATLNQRLSGSSGSVSANNSALGSFVTDFIAVSNMDSIIPYNVRMNWEWTNSSNGEDKVVFYNSNKTRIGNIVLDSTNRKNVTVLTGGFLCSLGDNDYDTGANWADVAYIRLQLFVKPQGTSITSADIENLTITFDHEGGTVETEGWVNTGVAFVPADYQDIITEINYRSQKNAEKISVLEEQIESINNGDDISTVYPSVWDDAVAECIAKIKALQIGRNCITFPFFSDNHQRNGYAGALIRKVMDECHIPYCFFGGDSISSGYIDSEATMIEQDKAFDDSMKAIPNGRFCRAVGNHDGFWNVSAETGDEYHYTDAQIYELFLREESIAQNKHFGGDGTYYYVDDIASKVRWIVLDTNDGTVEAEQITWLQNTALSFNESGWAVVFISHQPISNHYHANISNAADVRAIVKNYINGSTANKADIVGWYSGHIHRDRIYTGAAVNTSDDSVGADMGFKQVTITSDYTSIAYDDATKHPVANDDKSHAIDFVTINKTTRTVNLTRLGVGNDRSYTY